MTQLYFGLAFFLLLTIVIGLLRILRGPGTSDRMLATQLFGTTAVAVLLLLGEASGRKEIQDVALVFALLAALTAVAFVRRHDPSSAEGAQESDDAA